MSKSRSGRRGGVVASLAASRLARVVVSEGRIHRSSSSGPALAAFLLLFPLLSPLSQLLPPCVPAVFSISISVLFVTSGAKTSGRAGAFPSASSNGVSVPRFFSEGWLFDHDLL